MLGKKKDVEPVKEKKKEPEISLPEIEAGRCACGEPIAPGQTYVCVKHIRST